MQPETICCRTVTSSTAPACSIGVPKVVHPERLPRQSGTATLIVTVNAVTSLDTETTLTVPLHGTASLTI